MPRDANGVYTLPVGNPVVTGTVISSGWANTTMPDIGDVLSNSLDRLGRGGMQAPLQLTAGDQLVPAIYFASASGTGFFYDGLVPMLGVTFNGSTVANFTSDGVRGTKVGVIGQYDLPVTDGENESFIMTDGEGNLTFTNKGMVNVKTDTITLSQAQTTCVFTLEGTLAYYHAVGPAVDNGLLREGTDYTVTNLNTIELASTYPAGTELIKFVYITEESDLTDAVALAQAWAESPTEPDGPGTKSSKTWAGEAEGSATAAASSEANAASSEANAATSETNAATSEANAASSATNAATSESNAATSATNASASETNAASSAAEADTFASNADDSAGAAATSEANAAASAAEAAGYVGGISVANIVWDVDIPFSPAKLINKLDGPLTFERTSESTVINRSGIVETVAIDEPALGKDGIGIFEAVTNEFLWSEDFSKNNWRSNFTTQSISGTETFNGKPVSVYTVTTAPDAIHSGPIQDINFTAGVYICSYILKPKELGIVQFGSTTILSPNIGFQLCKVDFRDGTILSGVEYVVALQKLENGFWLFAHQFEVEVSTPGALTNQILSNNGEQTFTGNGTDGMYYYAAQLTKTHFLAPYIPTTDTPVTRAADECSIPMSGNMPPAGEPFTIIVDVAIPDYVDEIPHVFRSRTGQFRTEIYLIRRSSQAIDFAVNDGVQDVSCSLSGVDTSIHRFGCIFDGVNSYFWVDGITKSSVKTPTPAYGINGIPLYLGSYSSNGGILNSHIRNFKILRRALTDQEVAALGGPQ